MPVTGNQGTPHEAALRLVSKAGRLYSGAVIGAQTGNDKGIAAGGGCIPASAADLAARPETQDAVWVLSGRCRVL